MSTIRFCNSLYSGVLLCPALLAVTPATAQQIVRTTEQPHSIISLAPSPHPQGNILARHAGDATFANAPANYQVFATATVGEDAGVEALTLNFAGSTTLTHIKSRNKNFVIEPGGSCHDGNVYSRGESCTLLVRFNPQGPGHRLGFIDVTNTADASPMSFGLTGNGYAPVVSFTPSVISSIPTSIAAGNGTIKSATNLAIDGGDILYIADTGNNLLKEMDSTGVITSTSLGPIATPASLAADSFGIVYTANTHGSTYYFSIFYPWGSQTAYGYAYTSATCTVSAPCAFSAVGMNYPASMSIDPYNNLFFEEGTTGAAVLPVSSISGGSGTLNLWHISDQFSYSSGSPASFAVDANDNIYTKYSFSKTTCYLIEESLYSAEYSPSATRVAGGTACGYSGDGGQARSAEISNTIGQMAFDVAGNLYFADAGNQRIRRIDAATGIISTIAGTGTQGYTNDGGPANTAEISNPTGVAVDSQGQVYFLQNAPTAGPTQVLRKVGTVGDLSYGSQLKGTPSIARVATVSNTGNDTLTLSSAPMFSGINPGDFAIDPNTTNCVLTAGATLAPRQSCKIGVIFTPGAAGSRSANLVFQDNTLAGSNTLHVVGTGTLPLPTMSITSPTSSSTLKAGTAFTFAVSVTSTSSTKPTGTVTFKVNGTTVGGPVTLSSSGTASTPVTESTANSYALSAIYSGDANYATDTASESVSVGAAAKLPVIVNLNPAVESSFSCGPTNFRVAVSSNSGSIPTGTVELTIDSSMLASATLNAGAATLSTHGLPPGSHTFLARYGGDGSHNAGTSPAMTLIGPAIGGSCGGILPTGGSAR